MCSLIQSLGTNTKHSCGTFRQSHNPFTTSEPRPTRRRILRLAHEVLEDVSQMSLLIPFKNLPPQYLGRVQMWKVAAVPY